MKKKTLLGLCVVAFTALLLTACGATASKTITIKNVTLTESVNANYQAVNPKSQFKTTDTIYVSVDMSGRPTVGKLNGKFYLGDQLISEATLDFATANQGLIFSVGEDTFTVFNLVPSTPWPVGTGYHFDLYVNGTKTGTYAYVVIQ